MNFVIFSAEFPPKNGAEGFCTARFASALAEFDHSVHVVTLESPQEVSKSVMDFLVDSRVRITRIPHTGTGCNNLARLFYLTTEWTSASYPRIIATLKNVLKSYEKPILISRSLPETSHIVAWHCRREAYRWIAHFSDPIPFGNMGGDFRSSLWGALSKRWVRKVLRDASGISLTCTDAVRFYDETYGRLFNSKPVHVTRHIGEPPLPMGGVSIHNRSRREIQIVHSGSLTGNRGEQQIVTALDCVNAHGVRVRFIQVGSCCSRSTAILGGREDVDIKTNISPDEMASIFAAADISFIPDVQIELPYIPFMPSKFVYQLFSDKPLLLYSKPGSPMHTYYSRYPEAGLHFADYTKSGSLVEALLELLSGDKRKLDRREIRKGFTRGKVISGFVNFVNELVNNNSVC